MKPPRSASARPARLTAAAWALLPLLVAGCLPTRSKGERLYRRHCEDCHGTDGGGGIMYRSDEGANLLDETWRLGGDRSSIEYAMRPEVVSEHPTWEFKGEEIDQLVDHVQGLRGERRR